MEWLQGISNSLSDIFFPKTSKEIVWHAMDTPDWIKPFNEIQWPSEARFIQSKKEKISEEISFPIFLVLFILILYFLEN